MVEAYTARTDRTINLHNRIERLKFLFIPIICIFLIMIIIGFSLVKTDIPTSNSMLKGLLVLNIATFVLFGILFTIFSKFKAKYESYLLLDKNKLEEIVKDGVKEQEILRSEIHHRVKNNLALIIGMLNLYNDEDADQRSITKITDLKNKIYSLSLIQEKVINKGTLSKIELNDYINDITMYLISSFNKTNININISIPEMFFSPQKIIPLGLITSEILSYTLKHWPENQTTNFIEIFCKQNEEEISICYHFSSRLIEDDDVLQKNEAVSYQLISSQVHQLNGTIEKTTYGNEEHLTLKFPA